MNKHQTVAGPSCLTNAKDDEPLFVLRANDELAPVLVRRWAAGYYASKMEVTGELTQKQKGKYAEAMALADQMERWRADQPAGDE